MLTRRQILLLLAIPVVVAWWLLAMPGGGTKQGAPSLASSPSKTRSPHSDRRITPNSTPTRQAIPALSAKPPVRAGNWLGRPECWDECGTPCSSYSEDQGPICPKECDSGDECNDDELCLPKGTTRSDPTRSKRCQSSHCETHDDCGEGRACIRHAALETTIYMCMNTGRRTVGQPCMDDEYSENGLCQQGLQCVNGLCVPDSTCNGDQDCPAGAPCKRTIEGDSRCSPSCETSDSCPDGSECLPSSYGPFTCVERRAAGCLAGDGCEEEGHQCVPYYDSIAIKVTACMLPCDGQQDCAKGEFCGNTRNVQETYCYQHCNPDTPCSDGWQCTLNGVQSDGEDVEACRRDTELALDEYMETLDAAE